MHLPSKLLIIFQILLITGVTVIGDSFLKKANLHPNKFLNTDFFLGLAIYSLTAFAWVAVYKIAKFSLSGVIYSLFSILAFVVLGISLFGEKLSRIEYIGVGLAISSILLLSRFV